MARKASSLSYDNSLTNSKNFPREGIGAPLLSLSDCDGSIETSLEISSVSGPCFQDNGGIQSVGIISSSGTSSVRVTFKASMCFAPGPVLRIFVKVFRRLQLSSTSGLSAGLGLQQGKSSGVAGGGGSLGLSWSFLNAATDSLVVVKSSRDRSQFALHGQSLSELGGGAVNDETNKNQFC